jgi:hypothetical protein
MNILKEIKKRFKSGEIFDLDDFEKSRYKTIKASIHQYIKKNKIIKYTNGCYYLPPKTPDIFEYL